MRPVRGLIAKALASGVTGLVRENGLPVRQASPDLPKSFAHSPRKLSLHRGKSCAVSSIVVGVVVVVVD